MNTILLVDFAGVILNHIEADGTPIFNHELLTFLRPLKDRHSLHIYTNSYQLLQLPSCHSAVSTLFKSLIFAKQRNLPKTQPESYLILAQEFKVDPSDMIFIDDSPQNVLAAAQAGVRALLFESNRQVCDELADLTEPARASA